MGRVFRPWYYSKDRRRVYVKSWYAEWQDVTGKKTLRKKVGSKPDAQQYLLDREREVRQARAGMAAPKTPDVDRPLGELLDDYLAVRAAGYTSPYVSGDVRAFLTRTLAGCGWRTWRDVRADDLRLYLGRRRDLHGNSPATLNTYLRRAKAFAAWVADRLDAPNPLRKVKPYPEEVDRRRSRRILTDEELGRLVAGAMAAPRRHGAKLTGRDRAVLYQVAAYSGLRASELSRLVPESFDLESSPPTLTATARGSKGKREEPIPLPAHLVFVLRPYLKSKPKGQRLWPGEWAKGKHQGRFLADDLKRGGVAEVDAKGQRVTFHSLKARYVTRVIEAGAGVHEARRLARHKHIKTTLDHYAQTDMTRLGEIADRMPPPG